MKISRLKVSPPQARKRTMKERENNFIQNICTTLAILSLVSGLNKSFQKIAELENQLNKTQREIATLKTEKESQKKYYD